MPPTERYQPAPVWPSLGELFADPVEPAEFPRHVLRYRNQAAATEVGLDGLDDGEWRSHFGELRPLPRNLERPLALRYHGHQFRSYNPWIGDGRGFLHAQMLDGRGRLMDLGTKGSGTTPFSRGGDGRLTLKGAVREVLATEMLESLGVLTSRTLSVFETGESLVRHDEPSPTRAGVLVRLSWGHVRFGSFQRHAWERSTTRLGTLLEFAVDNYVPEARDGGEDLAAAFLHAVARRSARLVAQWTLAGFVHGVLNTDNMNITGESFDYGPWRFLPTYDPDFVAAYFDHGSLYAFGRQPDAMHWNLCRLADALLPLSSEAALGEALRVYEPTLHACSQEQLLWRLNLSSRGAEADQQLLAASYAFMETSAVPYERFFFDWYGGEASAVRALEGPEAARYGGKACATFRAVLSGYVPADPTRLEHPYFQGQPCSMDLDAMEATWAPIASEDDWSALDAKLAHVRQLGEALGSRGARAGQPA
ncbi:MAG: YdiU family protein [Deltaproteobacteria bacterium]|nr:YdiU family protein [Deltaproteobacteria bacterium]